MFYHLAGKIVLFILHLFRLLEVRGKQHIPANQHFIVTCTHRSWLDVVMLAAALYPTQVHYMAKKELFQSTPVKWFLRKLNAFPVNRENPGPSALKTPMKLLKEHKVVGIFPSGTRTDGEVPLKRGAVTIALKADVPILPASYHGPKNIKELFSGKKAIVTFGEPLHLNYTGKELNRSDQFSFSLQQLEKRIKSLDQLY